jgi:hypothetical protein
MQLGCPILWLAAAPLEITELAVSPTEKSIFWHCSVCGKWHEKRVPGSKFRVSSLDNPTQNPEPETGNQTGDEQ